LWHVYGHSGWAEDQSVRGQGNFIIIIDTIITTMYTNDAYICDTYLLHVIQVPPAPRLKSLIEKGLAVTVDN
jgi:hypothetical protein